ncbi:MAG TPA: 50S ribosomal protein L1 [Firmicutes bacterium]|nr:50S ribosomal protein L1 [Bacillota bacterium]
MPKHGKAYKKAAELVEQGKPYPLDRAVELVKSTSPVKFDASVDIVIVTGLDTRHADQQLRGAISLPHGTGKEMRVLVFCKGEKELEAREAGADIIGGDELAEEIKNGRMDFDMVLATPDMMKTVGQLGKVLGPRGMMPNPKTGTVTFDIGPTVKEYKAGKVNFRAGSGGLIQSRIGRVGFEDNMLKENIQAFVNHLVKNRPSGAKGQYIKKIVISNTMGPGIRVDLKDLTSGGSA